MRVAVVEASNKPHRYSCQAVMLLRKGAANNDRLNKRKKLTENP